MSNPVDEYYNKQLGNLEITPNPNLWQEKIAPQLSQQHPNKSVWMWRAAAAMIILLSGYFAFKFAFFSTEIELQNPVANQPKVLPIIEVAPTSTPENTIPTEHIAKTPKTQPAKTVFKKEQRQMLAAAELPTAPLQNSPKAVLNPGKVQPLQLETEMPGEYLTTETNASSAVFAYVAEQWNNFKDGNKLQAPPKEWIDLPKLAVRIEGNPVRGILLPKYSQPENNPNKNETQKLTTKFLQKS